MDLKIFLFMMLLCMMKTSEVESQEFLKDAYKSVKSVVVKGYRHVANIFMKHDHEDDDEDCSYDEDEEEKTEVLMAQEITTTIEPTIDVRFKPEKQELNKDPPTSFLRQDAIDDKDIVPDLDTRFFINAPCGDGMRKSASGCRQVIHN